MVQAIKAGDTVHYRNGSKAIYTGIVVKASDTQLVVVDDPAGLILYTAGVNCGDCISPSQVIAKQITKRELHLLLAEVETTTDAFNFALNLMFSLKRGVVTFEEYDMFSGDLQQLCQRQGIKTSNEIASLF